MRAVTVVADHGIDIQLRTMLSAAQTATLGERRSKAAGAVLRHVARLADEVAVPLETVWLAGEPAPEILDQARSWRAD